MKLKYVFGAALLALPLVSMASALDVCLGDNRSKECQSYLDGVVDGALMYKTNALGATPEVNGFQSRALKYRTGNRFQAANRRYCADRIPDRDALVQGLTEVLGSGEVKDQSGLTQAMYSLLDCQRLK